MGKLFDKEELFEFIARGWCAKETSSKNVDVVLAKAILESVSILFEAEIKRNVREFAEKLRKHNNWTLAEIYSIGAHLKQIDA